VKLRYARWQGAVAAAAVIAFIAATGWRYPAMAAGIGIGVVLVLKGATALIRRFGNSS
jgi:hypothetical protein